MITLGFTHANGNRQNPWQSSLGIVFCANDEAVRVINKAPILPQISTIQWAQFLPAYVWIISLVNIVISSWIPLVSHKVWYVLGCQPLKISFILHVLHNLDIPVLRLTGLNHHRSWMRCCSLQSKCQLEGIVCWPFADCNHGWSQKRFINWFQVVFATNCELCDIMLW
jgi:hypothetical protein